MKGSVYTTTAKNGKNDVNSQSEYNIVNKIEIQHCVYKTNNAIYLIGADGVVATDQVVNGRTK